MNLGSNALVPRRGDKGVYKGMEKKMEATVLLRVYLLTVLGCRVEGLGPRGFTYAEKQVRNSS